MLFVPFCLSVTSSSAVLTTAVMAVLVAVCVSAGLCVCVCITVLLARRNRRLSVPLLRPWDKDSTPLALPYVYNEDYYKSKYGLVPNSRLLSLYREDIELQEVIGEGHFGTVHKATIKNLQVGAIPNVVAAKTLKLGSSGEGMREFLQEARFMSHLDHTNIVKLFAISMSQEPFVLIFEYMEGGDLKGFVQRRAGSMERRLIFPDMYLNRNDSTSSADPPGLSVAELINICHQIACGMEHIASRGQVHRDLAARNCLVGQNMVVKIGDFGLSRSLYNNNYIRAKSGTDLPVRWIAPESLLTGEFRLHSDVWSFGVLMWEVFTFGHLPYYGRGNEEIVNLVCSGNTLDRPLNCSVSVYAIMKSCWQLDPLQRPTFAQLVATLEDCEAQWRGEELPTPSALSDIEETFEDDVFTDDEVDCRQDEDTAENRSASESERENNKDYEKEAEDVNISDAHLPVKV